MSILEVKNRFYEMGIKIGNSNRSQAMVPNQGIVIDNPIGSARGFHIDHKESSIIILPGVPSEMKNMIKEIPKAALIVKGMKI